MALADENIITRVRLALKDTTLGAYRWSDVELTAWILDGSKEIIRLRPEAHVGWQSGATNNAIPSNSTSLIDTYGDALLNYVLWRAALKDAEEGKPNSASTYRVAYQQTVGIS